jgi:hypothetical protein
MLAVGLPQVTQALVCQDLQYFNHNIKGTDSNEAVILVK